MGFKYLVIVESRAKCKKIESLLGSNYKCVASLGHICELEPGLEAIEVHNNFNPRYRVMSSKRKLVSELRQLCQKADIVYLAADPDREGEAIAKDLATYLNISKTAKRITFNEITKKAVQGAIDSPRQIDIPLCEAQKARRVLDRLVGFEVSPILWEYVAKRLSAGRCQSPALEILFQREHAIRDFKSKAFYSIGGTLLKDMTDSLKSKPRSKSTSKSKSKSKSDSTGPTEVTVKTNDKIDGTTTCLEYLASTLLSKFIVTQINKKDKTSNPPPPFTTSTLQQDSSTKLSLNPKITMQCAQRLYERGLITYMRTDSTCLSDEAKTTIGRYIQDTYGKEYWKLRNYQSKQANAQEAHEAIRPVKVETLSEGLVDIDNSDRRLYDLIWKRAVASQMTERRFVEQIATIGVFLLSNNELVYNLVTGEEETGFDGYTRLYQPKPTCLTPLVENELLRLHQLDGEEKETKPKARFTEASLVKDIERCGIGRPSTFSTIISTLMDRNYARIGTLTKGKDKSVTKQLYRIHHGASEVETVDVKRSVPSEKGKLFITELGESVRNFLHQHFGNLLSSSFTSNIEERLDEIAGGNESWVSVVGEFYQSFHPTVEKLRSESSASGGGDQLQQTYGIRGKYEYKRIRTKYGLALARNIVSSKSKAKYLTIVSDLYGDGSSLTLEQVYQLFRFPKTIQFQDGVTVELHYGRNGFYLKWSTGSMNLSGDYSGGQTPPSDVLSDVVLRIQSPDDSNNTASKILHRFGDLTVWNGRYGPFISSQNGRKTVTIPSEVDITTLTDKSCRELYRKTPVKKYSNAKRKTSCD